MENIDYLKKDLHYRLLKDVALRIELLLNERIRDISEYDIQAFMSLFLRRNLNMIDLIVHQEKYGRFDCAIANRETNAPIVLFELKTYLKSNEKLNSVRKKTPHF